MTKLQISPLLPGLRMSTLARNVSQVVLYENQVSDFVALLWMQTLLGPRTTKNTDINQVEINTITNSTCNDDDVFFICCHITYVLSALHFTNINQVEINTSNSS